MLADFTTEVRLDNLSNLFRTYLQVMKVLVFGFSLDFNCISQLVLSLHQVIQTSWCQTL